MKELLVVLGTLLQGETGEGGILCIVDDAENLL